MRILAIDTAISCITLAARNDDKTAVLSLDVGMHQSEKLLPAISYVLEQVQTDASGLDCCILIEGPGSFTGLRLGFAAVKALQLAVQCPVYGMTSLDAYALPYQTWNGRILVGIDAKKQRYYAAMYTNGSVTNQPEDADINTIITWITQGTDPILITGPDAIQLHETLIQAGVATSLTCFPSTYQTTAGILLQRAEYLMKNDGEPLSVYAGPVYLRKSEAEEKHGI